MKTKPITLRAGVWIMLLCALMVCMSWVVALAVAANVESGTEPSSLQAMAGKKSSPSATLTATLVDPMANAKEKTATVQVNVTGVKLIDPAKTNKKPTPGQGHLHYRVDQGPVIATIAPKLSFHDLTPGAHKIVVMLANNDHSPAGPEQTLEITIP